MKDIHFNLEKWQTGEYDVFTRAGKEVTQLTCFEANEPSNRSLCLAGVVNDSFKTFGLGGEYLGKEKHPADLVLRPKVKTIYYNVFLRTDGFVSISDISFKSKENAEKYGKTFSDYIKTIPVTNERE